MKDSTGRLCLPSSSREEEEEEEEGTVVDSIRSLWKTNDYLGNNQLPFNAYTVLDTAANSFQLGPISFQGTTI